MFIKKSYIILVAAFLVLSSCGKDEPEEIDHCTLDRYDKSLFTEVSRVNVTFGEAINLNGDSKNLLMDIYQPVGDDLEQRPVIIWAFGGGFYNGSRLDMRPLAEEAARRGYVSASIDYRLLDITKDFPDTSDIFKIVLMSSNDMKAAIRFLRHDADNNNFYNVDPSQIYIGGASSGSILSLHTAYISEGEELQPDVQQMYDDLGGYHGDSGLPSTNGYSHDVKGVINLAGAISDVNLIDAGDPPLMSFHGDMDEVVPYDHAAFKIGPLTLFELYGSKSMHEDALSKGVSSILYTVEGGDHGGIFDNPLFETDRNTFTTQYYDFLKDQFCM